MRRCRLDLLPCHWVVGLLSTVFEGASGWVLQWVGCDEARWIPIPGILVSCSFSQSWPFGML